MVKLAKGLRLNVPDREEFESFIKENAYDPGVHYDAWGGNEVPQAIYVVTYQDDDEAPYYMCLNKHVNGEYITQYYDERILNRMIDEDVVEKDGYDVDTVKENQ